ncbi:MAG: phosphoglycerate kinase [Bacteroidetes bacterium]|nr:phosphoglycerate kinase [Bacteroidota bacterium]
MQKTAESNGFAVVRDFVGHGIGSEMHQDPQVPNFGDPHQGALLKEGMVIAIEPMLNLGTYQVEVLDEKGNKKTLSKKQCQFVYRSSLFKGKDFVILGATFELKKGNKKSELLIEELKNIDKIKSKLSNSLFILGGEKPKDLMPLLKNKTLSTGKLSLLILMAYGYKIGKEDELMKKEKSLIPKIKKNLHNIKGPVDLAISVKGRRKEIDIEDLPVNHEILDIGKDTIDEYKKEIINDKLNVWASLFNKGVKYFQKGNTSTAPDSTIIFYDVSAESFKTAVKIEPDSIDTHRNLAFVLLNAQRYDEAIEPLQTIIDKRNSKDGYRFLGNIYYNKAKTLHSKFISTKNSEDSVAYIKMYDKAIEILEAGKKAFPSDSNILLALSNSYIGANKTDVAINAFKEGVERQPDNKYYHYNYGVLLLGSKKYVEAIEQFKAAEKIDANYENAIYNLGVVYVQWGDEIRKSEQDQEVQTDKFKAKYEAALPYLEKVIQLNDKEAAIWETLGKVYARLGKTSDAENAFNKSDSLR